MNLLNNATEVLSNKRFKAFYWSSAMMIGAGFVDLLLQSLAEFNLPNLATTVLGLILAQVSKYLNSEIK